MSKSYASVWLHYIWTTKKRLPYLQKVQQAAVFELIKDIAQYHEIHLDCINGIEDHVHAVVRLKATQNPAKVAKDLKGASARFINEQQIISPHFEWARGYFCFSFHPSSLRDLRQYIFYQEAHHQHISFEEEMDFFIKNRGGINSASS